MNYKEKKIGIVEVRRNIIVGKDILIADEETDANAHLFLLRENEKANDLLREATSMHETLAENLRQYKLRKKSSSMKIDCDSVSDSNID